MGLEIGTLSDREKRIILAVASGSMNMSSAQDVAYRMGYRPARSGTLACTKTLRSLEKRGIVGRLPPRDQWSSATWTLSRETRAALELIRKKVG